jgi:hypothetical protein
VLLSVNSGDVVTSENGSRKHEVAVEALYVLAADMDGLDVVEGLQSFGASSVANGAGELLGGGVGANQFPDFVVVEGVEVQLA